MERKDFLKACGMLCLGAMGLSLLESCTGSRYISATANNGKFIIPKSEYQVLKDGKVSYRKSVIARVSGLDFPVAVYRLDENKYLALLMRCTHQGYELNMNGDILSCSAHGSEFKNNGEVLTGPANAVLTKFNVTHDENNVYVTIS